MVKSRGLFISVVIGLVVFAEHGGAQKGQLPPIEADVETVYAMQDGREVRVHGRYYRSSDGRVREDSGSGTVIADRKAGTLTLLNAERRQAMVLTVPTLDIPEHPRAAADPEAYAQGTHEGYVVSKARVPAPDGGSGEVWVAPAVGLAVFSRTEALGMTTTRTLRRLRQAEPESTLFTIPADFQVNEQAMPVERKAIPPPLASPTRPKGR